jgi:ferredoxin
MTTLTIVTEDGERTADVPNGRRLVLAIEEQGVEIGHRCGRNARCTTCQVEVLDGEPDEMTAAEHAVLARRGLYGTVRLACQLVCNRDIRVRPLMTKASAGWSDTGPTPDLTVTPEARWFPCAELEATAAAIEFATTSRTNTPVPTSTTWGGHSPHWGTADVAMAASGAVDSAKHLPNILLGGLNTVDD